MLRSWRGFEQGDLQERLEREHKDHVPQGKLAAVYGEQAMQPAKVQTLFPVRNAGLRKSL